MLLNCKHAFHSSCITTWLQNQPTCPTCRVPVTRQCLAMEEPDYVDLIADEETGTVTIVSLPPPPPPRVSQPERITIDTETTETLGCECCKMEGFICTCTCMSCDCNDCSCCACPTCAWPDYCCTDCSDTACSVCLPCILCFNFSRFALISCMGRCLPSNLLRCCQASQSGW